MFSVVSTNLRLILYGEFTLLKPRELKAYSGLILNECKKKIVSLDQKPLSALSGLINPSQYFRVYNGIRVKSYVQGVLLDIMSNTKISKAHI